MKTKAKYIFSNVKDLTKEEYISWLESSIIWLAKCYKQCYDTFAYNKWWNDFTEEQAFNNHMHFPMIQCYSNLSPVLELWKMEVPKNDVSIWQISDIIEEKYNK